MVAEYGDVPMNDTKVVEVPGGSVTVTSRHWQKDQAHRIYFTTSDNRNGGQACWDVKRGAWLRVKKEFGYHLKQGIIREFGL